MRKITLFLASLLVTMGAMAQVYQVTDTKYTSAELNAKTEATYIAIKNLSATNHYYYVGNTGGAPYSSATFTNDAVFIWEPVAGETGSFYLKKLDGTYMQSSAPKDFGTIDNAAKFTTTNPTSAGSGSTFFNGDADSQAYINDSDDANLVRFVTGASWINVQNGDSGTPKYNTGPGGWTIHYAYAVEELSAAQVTYNYQLNGVTKKSVTLEQGIGTAYSAPTLDYVTFEQPEGTVPAEGATINLDCTQNLPFTLSESYDDATWYFMTIRSNSEKYVARSETAPYTNSATITTNDNGLWAFMGNVFDGIRVINKAAGNGQTLGFDATSTAANIYMKDGETSWIIQEGSGGFLLRQAEDYAIAHDYGSKLQFWNNASAAADPGSAFKIYSAEETLKELQQEWLKEWKEDALNTFGYVGGYPATMAEAINAVSTYAEALAFDADNAAAKIALVPGNYYRIQNVFRERMIGVNAGQRYPTTIGKTDVSQIWTFEAGENGLYYIKNLNGGDNGYMKSPDGGNDLTNTDAAALYTLTELGGAQYLLEINGRKLVDYGIKNGVETGLGGWSDNGKGSDGAWYIIPATELKVDLTAVESASYATGYYPFPVSASGNTTLNVGTLNADKSRMTLTAVDGIPANTGVVIVNSAAEAATTLTIGGEYATASNNALTGSCTAITENISNYLVLGIGASSGVLGFYETTAEAIPANKAFLEAGSLSAVKLDLGGEATAIENVELSRDNAPVFDLSGRRILTPVKGGVYIQNGKKFFVK